jgi:hypothetical protein
MGTLRTTTHPWFRGQADVTWNLTPGLYRGWAQSEYEREMLRDFRLRSSGFVDRLPRLDLEWLFIMRHHAMPTRLLDWTESYLTALYFAVEDYHNEADAGVWVLEPWSLNETAIEQRTVPTAEHPRLADYVLDSDPINFSREVKAELPVAVRPLRTSSRIIAQKGTFTIHGRLPEGLDVIVERINSSEQTQASVKLEKIVIDGAKKRALLEQLYLAGVSQSVLFPDLDGLCREISFRYSKDFFR